MQSCLMAYYFHVSLFLTAFILSNNDKLSDSMNNGSSLSCNPCLSLQRNQGYRLRQHIFM